MRRAPTWRRAGDTPAVLAARGGHGGALRALWLAGADCESAAEAAAASGLQDVLADATPAAAAHRRLRMEARRGELVEAHAPLLEALGAAADGAGGPGSHWTLCVTAANVSALASEMLAHEAAAEPYLTQRAEVRAALLPVLAAQRRARAAASGAAAGGGCAAAAASAGQLSECSESDDTASEYQRPIDWSVALVAGHLDEVRQLVAGAVQVPEQGAAGAARHAPGRFVLELLHGLRAARERAERLQAEAPQWLRHSVTALVGALAHEGGDD